MWSSDSEPDFTAITTASSSTCSSSPSTSTPPLPSPPLPPPRRHKSIVGVAATGRDQAEAEAEDAWRGAQWQAAWPRRPKPVVVAAEETDGTGTTSSPSGGDGVGRARSLTDEDLEELKACADLGFGFSYDEIPELRGTLPALELCYSMTMSQRFLDQHPQTPREQDETAATPTSTTTTSPPIANWKISSPGDGAEEVKARLKYWAQAVACTVRLCT